MRYRNRVVHVLVLLVSMLWITGQTLAENQTIRHVQRPFILWNRHDVASIRQKIKHQDWAKAELEQLKQWRGPGEVFRNLFLYQVMGDQKAGDTERQYLLSFIGAEVDSRPWSDQYLSALRYDVFYDVLNAEERKRIEETFRVHIRHELENDKKNYTRTSWLPNMQWPRKNGTMLMAVAMQDEALIRALFHGNGGWKWYFDEYIADAHFYNEEFGKHYSNIGEMLLWCRGLERLGLNELGYAYIGQGASGGATMRKYLESIYLVGYPRVDLGTERHHYPKLTMGDAKGKGFPGYCFQHYITRGYLTDGIGGNRVFMAANMNGRDHKNRKVEKMDTPMWFEMAHVKWPDAGFDYFLAQMRKPEHDRYVPSLFWGLDPINPDRTTAPVVRSAVYPQRGIVVLRANESEGYWESPDPTVTLRLATLYVHSVPDVFAITGFYAFNRPIYVNRQVSAGYAGTDPGWSNSIRSHASVQVDATEPRCIGELPTRSDFDDLVKFTAVRGRDIYEGVDQTRALFLTKDYLLDIFALSSDRPRCYQWMVHTLGFACPDNAHQWTASRHLVGTLFDIYKERSCVTDRTWSLTATQYTAGAHPELSGLGPRWFDPDRRTGVRVTMLGESGTIAYHGLGPVSGGARERIFHGAVEPGGVTIAAARNKTATAFVVLHEPFQKQATIGRFREIARSEDAVAVEIGGPDQSIHDIVMFRWGDRAHEEITLTGQGKSFTFKDYAFVRLRDTGVDSQGKLIGMKYPKAEVKAGSPKPKPKPISIHWSTDVARLGMGGRVTVDLHLRQGATLDDGAIVNTKLQIEAPPGIKATPSSVELKRFAPGDERDVPIVLKAVPGSSALLSDVFAVAEDASHTAVQATPLRLAHGVMSERTQFWPRDFARTIYAPRYILKFHYLDKVTAALVRDPMGLRRSAGGTFRPNVLSKQQDSKGRTRWLPMAFQGFQAFKPVARTEENGGRFLADMGVHPHGYSSPFEWRFYEDWALVKLKKPKPERVVYDWAPDRKFRHPGMMSDIAEDKMPGITLFFIDEKIISKKPNDGTEVIAMFNRPAGFEYGQATFYPPDSVLEDKDRVAQPADQPMAFTFCMEGEFAAFVEKWKQLKDLAYVKPWGQGDMGH